MKSTPRTDAGEYWRIDEFARQLERELNEAKNKNDKDWQTYAHILKLESDQWREVATAYHTALNTPGFYLQLLEMIQKAEAAFEALEKVIK